MKLMKKVLTLVLAVAILAGAAPSVAALTSAEVNDSTLITKVWSAETNNQLNDTEVFDFELAYVEVTAVGNNLPTDPNGLENGKKTVQITSSWKTNANGGISSAATMTYTELFKGISFITPGIYEFSLKEVVGSNPNIAYTDVVYTILVYVGWVTDTTNYTTENLKVYSITTQNASGNKTDASFPNVPAEKADLTIKTFVTGNAANINDKFRFNVTLKNISGTYWAADNSEIIADSNGTATVSFELKHGESYVINDLPKTAKYEVIEEASSDYEIYIGSEQKSTTGECVLGDGAEIIFTNNMEISAPTGIFMDIAPFAIMIFIAVIGAIIFFGHRRRRNHDDY